MGNYHLSYKDHNIWITVNNGRVEHYGATVNEATKEITCWIPSDNGKHFAIWFRRTSMGLSGLKIFVDGKHCESTICDKNSAYDNLGFVSYYVLPRGKVAPLHFSLADEEATQDFSAAQQSSVGEITVVVEKLQTMEPGRIVPSPDWLSKGFYKEPEYSMSEHNYLAAHRWRLPKDSDLRSGSLCTRRDVRATFIFKYRPLSLLQEMGLAPRRRIPINFNRFWKFPRDSTRLLSFKGHEICITIDGRTVRPYGIFKDEIDNQIICWIPSESIEQFIIKGRTSAGNYASAFEITVDGRLSGGRRLPKEYETHCTVWNVKLRDLEMADENINPVDANSSDEIGQIKITCSTIRWERKVEKVIVWVPISPEPYEKRRRSGKTSVQARHKSSNGTRLKEKTKKVVTNEKHITHVTTFIFNYRPLSVLREMGIAPLVSQDDEPDAHQTALTGEQEPHIKQESKECSLWECSSKIKKEPIVKDEFGAPGECRIKQEYDVKQEFNGVKQECEIKQEFGMKQEFGIKQESLVKQEFDGKREFDTGVLTREENAPERSHSQLSKRAKRGRSVESELMPAGRSSKRLRKGPAKDFSVHAEIIDLT